MVEGTWLNCGRRRRRRKLILTLLNGFTWTLFLSECNGMKVAVTPVSTPRPSTPVEDIIQPPKITLLNETSEYFGDISYRGALPMGKLLFQNETTYIVPDSRNFVLFECIADYPIFWNLAQSHIHPGVYHSVRVMSARKWKDPFDTKTFKYVTLLSLDGPSPKLTGNYSCQSAARHNIQSNIFLFWESSSGSTFVHSKENLTITASSADEAIQLPCQVTDPDSHPKLMIEQDKKDSYQDVHLNESIVYSPPVGYTLKNLPNPWGTYKCELDGSEFVSVRVLQKNENRVAQKSYTFDYDEKNKKVKCCNIGTGDGTGGGRWKTPKIYMMDCQHPSTCAMREHLFVDTANYFWNQGRRRGNCSVFNLKTYHNGVLRCAGTGFEAYKEFIVPVETYELNWNDKRNSTTYFRWEEIDPQKMIAVSSSTKMLSLYSFSLARRRQSTDDPNDEIIYSNQTVQLVCHTSRYYFASGVHWMLRWKNQTLTPVTDESDTKVMADLRLYSDRGKHLNMVTFIAQPDMEAAICFAPVWNSSLWVPNIHYLYVNESMPPTIENPVEIMNYTWYANETGKILSCSASGLPAPTFQWEKDNITILPSTHNYNVFTPNVTEPSVVMTTTTTTVAPTTTDSTTPPAFSPNSSAPDDGGGSNEEEEEESYKGGTNNNKTRLAGATTHTSIVIARVSYSTHGVFRCVATNVGGIVLKEFHITVLEAKSWTVTGMLVGASVITIALIAAIIYILQRLYQDRQEINRLAVTSLSRSSSVNFNNEMAGSNGSSRNGVNHGSGIREERPSPFTSDWDTHASSGIGNGNGRAEDGHNRSFDNGIMSNNLIDTY